MSLQLTNWCEWFTLLGRAGPTDQAMSDLLRWAWSSGVAKGYHSVNTDFTRIQKSGVSTILLKGQSYAMPPAAKSGEQGVSADWVADWDTPCLSPRVLYSTCLLPCQHGMQHRVLTLAHGGGVPLSARR